MELTDTDVEDTTDIHREKRAKIEANRNQILRRTGKPFNCFQGDFAEQYLRNNCRVNGDRS